MRPITCCNTQTEPLQCIEKQYRARKLSRTPFYKIISQHFDVFKQVYPYKYKSKYGYWRLAIDDVVEQFLKCGIPEYGLARIRCPDCGYEIILPFSCDRLDGGNAVSTMYGAGTAKQRFFCPSCHRKRVHNLTFHLTENVFEKVPRRHFVFTLPKRFRVFFRYDRKLLNALALCVWKTILKIYQSMLGNQTIPGMIISIQTFGDLTHWNPHIHLVVSDGRFDYEGSCHNLPEITIEPYLKLYMHKVYHFLKSNSLIDDHIINTMQSWKHSRFSVYRNKARHEKKEELCRIMEYISRGHVAITRLKPETKFGKVLYRTSCSEPKRYGYYKNGKECGSMIRNFEVYDVFDFIASVVQHIPDKGQHTILYYGWYSNKSRGVRRKRNITANMNSMAQSDSSPDRKEAHQKWAVLIKQVYEVNPLICPRCQGEMQIIDFITDKDIIEKILSSLSFESDTTWAPPRQVSVETGMFSESLPWH